MSTAPAHRMQGAIARESRLVHDKGGSKAMSGTDVAVKDVVVGYGVTAGMVYASTCTQKTSSAGGGNDACFRNEACGRKCMWRRDGFLVCCFKVQSAQ